MDNSEAMYWVVMLRLANDGDEEIKEMIQQENELRAKNNQPTIQEALKELADKAK